MFKQARISASPGFKTASLRMRWDLASGCVGRSGGALLPERRQAQKGPFLQRHDLYGWRRRSRRPCCRRLRKMLDAEFYRTHGANAGDKILTEIIDGALEISQKVVVLEKALRAN